MRWPRCRRSGGWRLLAADGAEVLRADQLLHVVVVVQQILDRRRLIVLHEHAHAGDAHDAAGLADRANGLVRLEARVTWRERPRIQVRDEYRSFRDLERIQRGAIAAMRDVDGHADGVHPLDNGHTEVADALVATLG